MNDDQPNQPKLLDQVRNKIRLKHMSKRTETAYVNWILDFLHFHKHFAGDWIHPKEMGGTHISQYLEHLAVDRKVARPTQNQAMSALLFPFKKVCGFEPLDIEAPRAAETDRLLGHANLETTMIYTHVSTLGATGVKSPLDQL